MKMVSMKIDKAEREKLKEATPVLSGPSEDYPWGLRLNLGNDELKKLPGLHRMDAEDVVEITAKCKVLVKSVEERNGEKTRRMELQIIELGVDDPADEDTAFNEDDDED